MYYSDIAVKSLVKRKRYCDEKAVKAITEERYEDAARYVAEAAGYMGALNEIAFMLDSEEVD